MPSVWTIPANGAEDITETYGFLTDVLPSYKDTEQRVKLRRYPLESLEFSVLPDDSEAQLMHSLVYAGQAETMVVPLWHYGTRLGADLNPGNTSCSVPDEADVPYRVGAFVLIWRDAFTWELFTCNGQGGGLVGFTAGALGTWPANSALVFPARLARLTERQGMSWVNTRVVTGRVRFTMEQTGAMPDPAAAPATYRGQEILAVEPTRDEGAEDQIERAEFELNNRTGSRSVDAVSLTPRAKRIFNWLALNRGEAKLIRGFIERHRGRGCGFWTNGWQRDLTLVADLAGGASSWVIDDVEYASRIFPLGRARRHVGVLTASGWRYREILAAVDNANGTESLVLDAPIAEALTPRTLIAFLRYARLDVDEPQIDWLGSRCARARLPMVDLPGETP